MSRIGYTDAIKTVAKFIGNDEYMAQQEIMKQLGLDPINKFQNILARGEFNRYAQEEKI